jgi:hypothetical protein
LTGFSVLEDQQSATLFGNRLRIYVEKDRAGFDVAPLNGGDWEQVSSRNLQVILHMRMLLGVIRELGGMDTADEDAWTGPCPVCGDRGWFPDQEGNEVPCAACGGRDV